MERSAAGRLGEDAVAKYLVDRGATLVGRNIRVGRLELDLVVRLGELSIVVEVRTRTTEDVAAAWTFDRAKRLRVRRAALSWWSANAAHTDLRIDAAAVTVRGGAVRIEYFENAFAEG